MSDNVTSTFEGSCFHIRHCDGAKETLDAALKKLRKNKAEAYKRQLMVHFERLSEGKRLSSETIRKEGNLPCLEGKIPKCFWALKKIPIRAYFWYSDKHPSTCFVSHYIYKDFDKLSQSDINIIHCNWNKIERG